jgi:signal transduction histidine kinase/ActR/RegA family two-component response regulator
MPLLKRVLAGLLRLFSSSTLDSRTRPAAPDVAAATQQAQGRAYFETVPAAMLGQMVASAAIYWVLSSRVNPQTLLWWLMALQVLSVCRLAHAGLVLTGRLPGGAQAMRTATIGALIDGVVWGALGWGITPLDRLDVAVVTISMLLGVAAMGALLQHVNLAGVVSLIVPLLVPNAFFAATRHDDLGYFCLAAVLGFTAMLLLTSAQSNRRILEMLRLRYQSEQVSKDKTEALEQARQLADTKSRFLATMSHEMRTPLHGILGLLRLVRQDVNEPKVNKNLALIQSSGEHLVSVINDVLEFSKSEASGLAVHEESFCLHAAVSELADTCRVSCMDKGLMLAVQLDMAPHEHVQGDPVRIRQVLHNLIGNAIKFTPHGTVGLHVWRDGPTGSVMVEVSDTGIGIAPQEVPRVFEAFHQAEGTYERRFGGTGLGLTISRDLCRAMGGDLHCDSEVGKGTVFTCVLPLPRVQEPVDKALPSTLHETRPWGSVMNGGFATPCGDAPHVLLVEDNPVNALVAQALLDRFGIRATSVDKGRDAIDCLTHQTFDLILMDCEMPGMDGIEATRRIRDLERKSGRTPVPIVALTANGPEVFAERCAPAGMNDHLLKPFRPQDLAEVLMRHLPLAACAD